MNLKPTRYIDLTTDYGFKRIFGTEVNKDLLIAFLNEIFKDRKVIQDLIYNPNEHQGDSIEQGAVIFDLTCTAENGEQFIIEMQCSSQVNLKKRMLYYGSKLIADQAPKGERRFWNYNISEVYVIVLMDGFRLTHQTEQYLHDIALCDRNTGTVFYEDLGFTYIELLNFNKTETELQGDLDKWLFVLRNISKLDKLPEFLSKPVFEKVFKIAEYVQLSKGERDMYNVSLKRKWDEYSLLESAKIEGLQQGLERGKLEGIYETAKNMLAFNMDPQIVAKIVNLPVEEIRKLS
ncbi:Rpn family recombination-promoting nuclease/putative transposase [Lonepinella sp. BR2271]|uniref:Rpn family recombination-promoting nuclease/putative transposase n=1 Tax=Lonepinella sp. BR2271 TaxID=3434550 RepID=UPI003F6E2AB2